jgi:hypothetical protein
MSTESPEKATGSAELENQTITTRRRSRLLGEQYVRNDLLVRQSA